MLMRVLLKNKKLKKNTQKPSRGSSFPFNSTSKGKRRVIVLIASAPLLPVQAFKHAFVSFTLSNQAVKSVRSRSARP